MTGSGRRVGVIASYGASALVHTLLLAALVGRPEPPRRTEAVAIEIAEVEPREAKKTATVFEPKRVRSLRHVALARTTPRPPLRLAPAPDPTPANKPPVQDPKPGPVRIGMSLSSTATAVPFAAPVGSTLHGQAPRASDPAQAGGRPASWNEVNELPVLLESSVPKGEYPEQARRDNFEGSVKLRLVVDEQGLVRVVTVLVDPGHGLGPEAVRIARRYYRFRPARRDGEPVAVEIPFTMRFELP